MLRRLGMFAIGFVLIVFGFGTPSTAQQAEPRLALVIGNAGYGPGALPTALNDAGLVAEALRSIGFEIVEGGDLSQPDMLRAFRDFLGKVEAAGPDAIAAVYFSGHAVTFEGENFLLGVDARLDRESDIPIEGVRLSDLLRPLADSPALAKIVMIDAARPLPFRPQGRGLAPGLEAIEAPEGMLVAYSNAPAAVAPDRPGNYGAYATALAEMLRAPGTDLDTAFTHIRSRTHLLTQGEQTPWHDSELRETIELVPPQAATAVAAASLPPPPPPMRAVRPMRQVDPEEAYAIAIEQDTLDGYVEFVEVYPDHPYAERVWYIVRTRREAMVWRRALVLNTREAYWTYLRRYPNGIYAYDAERRLRRLSAPIAPPVGFALLQFIGIPLALRNEPRDFRRSLRVGPPPPSRLLRPAPASIANLPPPRRSGTDRRSLPSMSAPIPAISNLTPARRSPTDTTRTRRDRTRSDRPPGAALSPSTTTAPTTRTAPGSTTTPPPRGPRIAPSTVTPSPGATTRMPSSAPGVVAPSTTTTSPTTPPGTRPPPGTRRPPEAGERRPGSPPPGARPPGSASTPPTTTPPGSTPQSATPPTTTRPGTVAPSTTTAPPTERRRPDGSRPPPPGSQTPTVRPQGGPPPGTVRPSAPPQKPTARPAPPQQPVAKPAPPQQPAARPAPAPQRPAPPPAATSRPAPPPAARPAPPPQRPAPPPPAAAKPAPPPPKPAAAPAKPPSCPAGQVMANVGGRQVCQTPR